jgi:hypothetical protein
MDLCYFSKTDINFIINSSTESVIFSQSRIITNQYGYNREDNSVGEFFTLKLEGKHNSGTLITRPLTDALTVKPGVIFGAPCPPVWYNQSTFVAYLSHLAYAINNQQT